MVDVKPTFAKGCHLEHQLIFKFDWQLCQLLSSPRQDSLASLRQTFFHRVELEIFPFILLHSREEPDQPFLEKVGTYFFVPL